MSRNLSRTLLRTNSTIACARKAGLRAGRLNGLYCSSAFSTVPRRCIMETTGFTEEQLTVREAVSLVCSQFPNTYWQEHDQTAEDPKEFHAALAKDGWLGIALPEELGGSGLGRRKPSLRTF